MSSREEILKAIKANKPAAIPLPQVQMMNYSTTPSVQRFTEVLTAIGGQVQAVHTEAEVWQWLQGQEGKTVIAIEGVNGYNSEAFFGKSANELEDVDRVVVRAKLGVGENGAVWLSEKAMGNRLLPFICQQLVVVVHASDIVANMHEAYDKIRVDEEGYGAFIAGPSKTADIEQSLVIGAHGPLGLVLFLVGS